MSGLTLGVSTSAYQTEGAVDEDGRGVSIWDRFAHTPGKVPAGDHGDVACDHYHRWPQDLDIVRDLGVHAYRFSISWPRIFPTGFESKPNEPGLDFYERMVDGILERGIVPWVTLYHWDLPQPVQDVGGWAHRTSVSAFERLIDAVTRRLGDRVTHYNTINEPWCAAILGYEAGQHAPGVTDRVQALQAAHHLLLAHGRAVPIVRANSPGARVGMVVNPVQAYAASPSPQDADAVDRFHAWFNQWFIDPLAGRGYPERIVEEERAAGHWPGEGDPDWLLPGDLSTISVPCDFLGVNYYSRSIQRGPEEGNLPRVIEEPADDARTDIGWEVYPDGLYDLVSQLHRDYRFPSLAITECGAAYDTEPDADGRVRDARRVDYLSTHIQAAERAREDGVPLEAFFVWSLLDNFEWNEGYARRFGIVHVDFDTQQRTLKDSALWLKNRLRS